MKKSDHCGRIEHTYSITRPGMRQRLIIESLIIIRSVPILGINEGPPHMNGSAGIGERVALPEGATLQLELSPQIIDYPDIWRTNHGQFARIGGLVLVSPIKSPVMNGSSLRLTELLRRARQSQVTSARIGEQLITSEFLGLPQLPLSHREASDLNDAGGFRIHRPSDISPSIADSLELGDRTVVTVADWSLLFGRGGAAARVATVEAFQQTLGPGCLAVNMDTVPYRF
jgi:hypothetical protein